MGIRSSNFQVPGGGTDGYHVLGVAKGSPGEKADFEPFFDYIISVNGIRLDQDDDQFREILKQNIDKSIDLVVYNTKTQTIRQVSLVPSTNWGGDVNSFIGLSIRLENFQKANENVWHVLDVYEHSPASLAGLRPFTDYIIGTEMSTTDEDDFSMLIERCHGKPTKFYVYNSETDTTRVVTLTPNIKWGGEGYLGCGIGYGYLHRIPFRRPESKPVTKPNPALLNADKTTLLASMAPPNMNFTFQPANLPPLTITMPRIMLPVSINSGDASVNLSQTPLGVQQTDVSLSSQNSSNLSNQLIPNELLKTSGATVINNNHFTPLHYSGPLNGQNPNTSQYYFQPISSAPMNMSLPNSSITSIIDQRIHPMGSVNGHQ